MIDPEAHIPGYWGYVEELTARAIELNIWHEDDEGNVVKEPRFDAAFEKKAAAFRFKYEREDIPEVPPKLVKPVRKEILAPKADADIQFNQWQRRAAPTPSNPDEDARLIAEAIAGGKVTKCPPGYARNIK